MTLSPSFFKPRKNPIAHCLCHPGFGSISLCISRHSHVEGKAGLVREWRILVPWYQSLSQLLPLLLLKFLPNELLKSLWMSALCAVLACHI